jgi:hypothetical protein
MLKSTIALVLALSLLWARFASAEDLAPPARGTVVELTTSGARETGEFIEEIKIGAVTYWSLRSVPLRTPRRRRPSRWPARRRFRTGI